MLKLTLPPKSVKNLTTASRMPVIAISPTAFTSASTSASLLPPRLSPSLPPRRFAFHLRHRRAAAVVSTSEPTAGIDLTPEDNDALSKVGARVRVTGPLKVYHVPKVPEIDLTGREGIVKQYVCLWKGKRISANLPFKVEFELPDGVDGRPGPLKFVAHLREDEFEYVSGG